MREREHRRPLRQAERQVLHLTAILFVVFDIEAMLIYPWTTQFRALGWTGLATMASFLVLIVVALAYVWKKGALEWES